MANFFYGFAIGVVATVICVYGVVLYAIKKAADKNAKRF